MRFTFNVRCNQCGSLEVAAEVDSDSEDGSVYVSCLNKKCGVSELYEDRYDALSLNEAFRVGNGLMEERWFLNRLVDAVRELIDREDSDVRNPRKVFVSRWILHAIEDNDYLRDSIVEVCGLRVVPVDSSDEIIRLGDC